MRVHQEQCSHINDRWQAHQNRNAIRRGYVLNQESRKGGIKMMIIGIIIWVFGMCLSQATGHGD